MSKLTKNQKIAEAKVDFGKQYRENSRSESGLRETVQASGSMQAGERE